MNYAARISMALVLLTCTAGYGQQPAEGDGAESSNGVISQVTLYRDQARVTRRIAVKPGAGLKVIEVPQLPEHVIPESVFAEGDAVTSVRAVRVSTRPLVQSNREEIRKLDDELENLQNQRDEAQHQLEVNQNNLKSLEQMISFTSEGAKTDLNRGVLDAKTITELAQFAMTQRKELSTEQFGLKNKIAGMDLQTQVLQTKKRELSTGSQSLTYQAKLFIETEDGAAGQVRLNYVVTSCGWSPQYTIRGRIGEADVELSYSALVQQLSGEDWNGVQLTLSTASPSVSASRPRLTPFRVTIEPAPQVAAGDDPFGPGKSVPGAGGVGGGGGGQALSKKIKSLREQQQQAEVRRPEEFGSSGPQQRDVRLNSLAGQMQQIELQAAATSWRTFAEDVNDDVASQTYKLEQPVSLETRRQQQLVQILKTKLAAEMYHVATPLLSSYAYREAQMTNTGTSLLSGPASIYLDDRFVGRMQIPSTASGQLLTIGLGADQQVRTRRELMDKEDDVQGGNRRLKFVYRLVINNFKGSPVKIRLLDRMPITRQQQQLSVSLDPMEQPLSDDGLYTRVERPVGVLRWDLTVPEGRHGSEAYDVQYSYTAEFDRSRILSAKDMLQEMQVDYREMSLPAAAGGGGFGGGMGGMGGGGLGGGGAP